MGVLAELSSKEKMGLERPLMSRAEGGGSGRYGGDQELARCAGSSCLAQEGWRFVLLA